jgi:arsenite methyltransferase
VTSKPLDITNEAMKRKLGQAKFFSATYRLFKLDGLDPACEDYGQAVIYKGSLPDQPEAFELDGHHLIERGKVFPVCGNTWRMLADTRFAPHFDFMGDSLRHLPRLRHVDPLRHYNVCRVELWWQLLLTRKNVHGA